jgi:hypothetical protein
VRTGDDVDGKTVVKTQVRSSEAFGLQESKRLAASKRRDPPQDVTTFSDPVSRLFVPECRDLERLKRVYVQAKAFLLQRR